MFRVLSAISLCILCIWSNPIQAADKPIKGTIVKIEKDKESTIITVAISKKKKDKEQTSQEEKKYTLTNTTKVEKLSGKKDNQTRSESSRDELKEGQSITLVLSGEKVEKIEFTQGKKSK